MTIMSKIDSLQPSLLSITPSSIHNPHTVHEIVIDFRLSFDVYRLCIYSLKTYASELAQLKLVGIEIQAHFCHLFLFYIVFLAAMKIYLVPFRTLFFCLRVKKDQINSWEIGKKILIVFFAAKFMR